MANPNISPSDCIKAMVKGSALLKCGRNGKPHFRNFTLSENFEVLKWTSPKKKGEESSVQLADVKELRLGQKTAIFARNRNLALSESTSFSIIYMDRTLDIICKDKKEFDVWVTGLKILIEGQHVNLEVDTTNPTPEDEKIIITFRGTQTIVNKREDGNDVYTWGQGINGRLGHGDESDQLYPKVVEPLLGKDVRSVECGPSHTAAINADGELFTWGSGNFGRLGHGHERDRFSPLVVAALKGIKIIQVSCGDFHTAALSDQGEMFTWGKGSDGRLGHGNESNESQPRPIEAFSGIPIGFIACGYVTTAAIARNGSVFTWGGNEKGQLGNGDKEPRSVPTEILLLLGQGIIQIACATWHSVAITVSGDTYTWGNGSNGKLGLGDEDDRLTPTKIEAEFKAKQVSCGDFHTAVLTSNGEIYTWGEGNYGQLGLGENHLQCNTPKKVSKPIETVEMAQIACGSNHTAAITNNGQLYVWGYGVNGRLGHGDEVDQLTPKLSLSMTGKHVRKIACGGSHSACTIVHSWVPDEESTNCMACKKQFTFVNRRHHCRNCGGIYCGACSSKRFPLLKDGFTKPVRVCDRCYSILSDLK